MEDKKNNNKLIIIALAILLAGVLAYTFYINNNYKKVNNAIKDEKVEIEQNLDSMIVKYEDAISQNTSMSNELSLERDRIIGLRDSIKNLKATDYRLIRKYRRQIAALQKTNQRLFYLNDSLTGMNTVLQTNLDSANVKISTQKAMNDTLSLKNLNLSQKVAIASVLKVKTAKILAMRTRNNGKLVETSRARNTDAFRINFTIDKNEITDQGEREVYIQIMDAKGNTIAPKGSLMLADETTTIDYSDKTIVNYLNEAVDVISLVEVNRDNINRGAYMVNIFINNKFAGETKIVLK
ncbi:MAG: hypothetical protein R3342_08425 [Lutibacter sp.]|jgi:hypothetical protein|uniref:hypothetical protein n=1 Tax=Lutibacter sp. TaxID=1925666 RepID=UPI00299EEC8B|nr:hypothetical protein [Lutibacter sp.]MDX1829555.1 hypothetical protein [Lutibacter sp.]